MKFWLHIILSLVILYPSWVNTSLLVNYTIKKKYYAQTLCENKDKPEMHCEGSCQFSKQLRATDTQNDQKEIRYVSAELQLFLSATSIYFLSNYRLSGNSLFYELGLPENFPELPTPPPQFS